MEAIYVLRVGLPDGYDGPVLWAPDVMHVVLELVRSGEDDVPASSVTCERVDVAPSRSDAAVEQRAMDLLGAGPTTNSYEDDLEAEAYERGWNDGLREVVKS